MKAVHTYSKLVRSTYTFSEYEVLDALCKEFKLTGWPVTVERSNLQWDEEKGVVTITISHDQPLEQTEPKP